MRLPKYFIMGYIAIIIILIPLIGKYSNGNFNQQIQYFGFVIDLVNITLSILICLNLYSKYKLFLALPIWATLLFIMDIAYQVVHYLNMPHNILVYDVLNYSWYLVSIIALLSLLIKFGYQKRENYFLLISLSLISLIIGFFFSPAVIKYLHYWHFSIELSVHVIIIYLCLLLIILSHNKYILITISGFCLAEIGSLIMLECYLQNYHNEIIYGAWLWYLGEFIISIGLFNIIKHQLYNPHKWFLASSSIRSKLSFIIFHTIIGSFVLGYVILQSFNLINNDVLLFIPAAALIYALLGAILTIIVGQQIEKPFLLIKRNIASILEDKKIFLHRNKFRLLEFKELQDFFIESYEYKSYIQKQVVSIASRVAHDIRSPILVMENLISSWDKQNNETITEQLIKQINKISYISRSMLKENKDFASKSYGLQSLFNIAYDLVSDKKIEWADENLHLNLDYSLKKVIWLTDEQALLKTVLSNLLNNAYEASRQNKQIDFTISANHKDIYIKIQDYGVGIPRHELDNVLYGKSLKLGGNGVGLSSAKKFAQNINGELTINSLVNQGTSITLRLPRMSFPSQYAQNITINTPRVVVLDDNVTIINKWQNIFLSSYKSTSVQYFINFASLKQHLTTRSSTNEDTTYLLDYNVFGEKLTGADIIKEFALTNVYLITNYAEDNKLQDEINALPIKLIPKAMLENDIIEVIIN